jgi:hypothetical protein
MSTSKLQKYVSKELSNYLSEFEIYENYRPYWLNGLELDFYIPKIKIAIEVQGDQHSKFVPHFHKTFDNFLEQLKRDKKKADDCFFGGIKLHEVCNELDADILIIDLFEKFHSKKISDCEMIELKKFVSDGYSITNPIDRRLKFAIRAITRNHDIRRADKLVAKLIQIYSKLDIRIQDKTVIDFYNSRKLFIDNRINNVNPIYPVDEQKQLNKQMNRDIYYQKLNANSVRVYDDNNIQYGAIPFEKIEGSIILNPLENGQDYIFESKTIASSAIFHYVDDQFNKGIRRSVRQFRRMEVSR